jgi:CRP/FNR family cyclic AMP-dependent transcriptional regulator
MMNPIDYSISKFIKFADDDAMTMMRDLGSPLKFKKDAVIETRGEPVDHIYLIENGLVQLGINGADGSKFNLTRLGSGHTFGETAFFLKSKVIHDAHAESEVLLRRLSGADVDHLLTHSLSFSKALMAVSCMRLQTTLSYIGDKVGMTLQGRVAKQILSVSKSAGKTDIIKLRQVDLAHALGVSRVSIGKALKELSDYGLIEIGYGNLTILSQGELVELVRKSRQLL